MRTWTPASDSRDPYLDSDHDVDTTNGSIDAYVSDEMMTTDRISEYW